MGVDVIDAGTPGLDLVSFLGGRRAAIIVDSVRDRGAPGSIHVYDKQALLEKRAQLRMGPHEPALKDTLLALEFAGQAPEQVIFVGVIPESVRTGARLSAAVQAAAPLAAEEVVRQIAALGIELSPREPKARPAIWWEAPSCV